MSTTTIRIPGTQRTVDLLKIPLHIAVEVLNAHNVGVNILRANGYNVGDSRQMAWGNAERALLTAGKIARRKNGVLAIRKRKS